MTEATVVSFVDDVVVVAQEAPGVTVVADEEVVATVVVGHQGPPGGTGDKGDKGDQGIPGLSGANYVHDQMAAADSWVIDHMLNRFPSITVVDSAGSVVYGDEVYETPNRVRLNFSVPFSGKAFLN